MVRLFANLVSDLQAYSSIIMNFFVPRQANSRLLSQRLSTNNENDVVWYHYSAILKTTSVVV